VRFNLKMHKNEGRIKMKKVLSWVITIFLVASLTLAIGCTKANVTPTTPSSTPTTQSPVATQTSPTPSPTPTEFNPDTNPDKISYDQLEAKFGPVPSPTPGITIGAVFKNLANEFWVALEQGYQNKAKEYGIQVDCQATRSETDLDAQLSILETMIGKGYKGYLLSPLSNENLNSAVAKIKATGLPIVNVNCEFIADADVFVGSMQLDIGRLAGEYIGQKLGGKGKVAIIEGVPGSYTSTCRVSGFKEVIQAKYPGIEIVASQPADYEREKGMNVAMNILTAHPDLDAIYGCNDNMALGAVEALRTVGKLGKVLVIGIDGTKQAYESIAKGELTGTIDQFPMKTGEIAMEVLLRLLGGQHIPRVVSTPIKMIDSSNYQEYMPK